MRLRRAEAAALVLAAVTACRTAAPPPIATVPDPLDPPLVGAPLDEAGSRAARAAVGAAEAGRQSQAARWLAQLPSGHPVAELVALEVRFLAGEAVAIRAEELARRSQGYAAAWSLSALAAEREGRLHDALASAQSAASLQADGFAKPLAARLERRYVDAVLRSAGDSLQEGRAAEAAEQATAALELVPGAIAVRVVAVRASLDAGAAARAAGLVGALPDTAEGLELKGRVAAALGQPELAIALLERLPAGYPNRCALLAAGRAALRRATAPPSFAAAQDSSALRRGQLAVILAWEVPGLEGRAAGPVPVFEDIVDIAERREVVTVVRAGLMTGDPIARRFFPGRSVTAKELETTLDRVAAVLQRAPLGWCRDDAAEGCTRITEPVDGPSAVALTRRVVGGEGAPCR